MDQIKVDRLFQNEQLVEMFREMKNTSEMIIIHLQDVSASSKSEQPKDLDKRGVEWEIFLKDDIFLESDYIQKIYQVKSMMTFVYCQKKIVHQIRDWQFKQVVLDSSIKGVSTIATGSHVIFCTFFCHSKKVKFRKLVMI